MKRFAILAVAVSLMAFAGWVAVPVDGPHGRYGAAEPRSGKWPAVRAKHLAENPECIVCGKKGTASEPNQVHHAKPHHLWAALELEPSNLRTVCLRHHFAIAHLERWSSWNESIDDDAETWGKRLKSRP